jgi:hypothetical protein
MDRRAAAQVGATFRVLIRQMTQHRMGNMAVRSPSTTST